MLLKPRRYPRGPALDPYRQPAVGQAEHQTQALGGGQGPRQGQTKAGMRGPAAVIGLYRVGPEETPTKLGQHRPGQRGRGIGDHQAGRCSVQADFHLAAGRGMFDGVVEQDRQQPCTHRGIGIDPDLLRQLQGTGQVALCPACAQTLAGAADQSGQLQWLGLDAHQPGLVTGQGQQAGHGLVHLRPQS